MTLLQACNKIVASHEFMPYPQLPKCFGFWKVGFVNRYRWKIWRMLLVSLRNICLTSSHLPPATPYWYLRARRLTEAARTLAAGAPDILAVALDAGFGSDEAFTRAVGHQFGITPELLRGRRSLDQLSLMEPLSMLTQAKSLLHRPRSRPT